MTNPQFPDPLGMREVARPGATASKAGPDLLQRVAALEQGALGRPGPEVSNGSVITSDTSQTGGVKWVAAVPGRDAANRVASTSAYGSGSIANGANSTAITSITVDGLSSASPIELLLTGMSPFIAAGATTHFLIQIWDGTIGSGTVVGAQQFHVTALNTAAGGLRLRANVAAFTGSKTFSAAFFSQTGGNSTFTNQASSAAPTVMTARWVTT